jgi:hypothetical protein
MTFEDVYLVIDIGTLVTISSGEPPPDETVEGGKLALARWKSVNFTGTLVERGSDFLAIKDTTSVYNCEIVRVINADSKCTFSIPNPEPTLAEKIALNKIEKDAEDVSLSTFRHFRRQIAVMILWQEIQRLKLSNATGNYTTLTGTDRAKQFPTLSALAQVYGTTVPVVATAAESRLQDQVYKMVMFEAKLMFAQDQIKAAATAEEKIAAANVTWE